MGGTAPFGYNLLGGETGLDGPGAGTVFLAGVGKIMMSSSLSDALAIAA